MRLLPRSTPVSLLAAACGSALVAVVLLLADPSPDSVFGQQPGSTVAAPPTPVVEVRTTAPVAPAPAPQALPRTGSGTADTGLNTTHLLAYGLLAGATALGSAGLVRATRRVRR
jgi:hypothetical protein